MRKIFGVFTVAVCCMFMAMPVQAQLIKWGVRGGVNLSKLDVSGIEANKDNTTGFFIGPMAELTIPLVGLGVDGALLYSQKGKDTYKQQGIEVPINLKYTIGLGSMFGIYFAAGPDFFFDFKENKDMAADLNWDEKKTQVAINVGAGVKLLKHLQLGATYQIPMGDSFTFENTVSKVIGKGKVNTWQVSAAYIF